METVGVISANGATDKQFCDELREMASGKLQIDFVEPGERAQKEKLIDIHLRRCKDRCLPLIVLISIEFFNVIWSTTMKTDILKNITKYVNKSCLHIWLDNLDETKVKRYSTALCRTDGLAFRRIKKADLMNGSNQLYKIKELLTGSEVKLSRKNFSLQNIDDKGRIVTKKLTHNNEPSISDETPQLSGVERTESWKTPRRTSESTVRDGMLEEEVARASVAASLAESSNKKRKNKKKKIGYNTLLSNLKYSHIHKIAALLDKLSGSGWKRIAELYHIDRPTIQAIEGSVRFDSPTMSLFTVLGVRMPDITSGDFLSKCKSIKRNDVVQLMETEILKTTAM